MKKEIALLPGDGIGPEVVDCAQKVLKKIAEIFGHHFDFKHGVIGAKAIEETGDPLPKETLEICLKADAILLGAVGDPKYDLDPKAKVRPEQGLLRLRKELGLFANLRPVFVFPFLKKISPLKEELLENVDFIFVRELTGGIYFGEPRGRSENGEVAFDTCIYSKNEILRVAKIAFELAKERKKKVTLVDKANVLATSRLWRETIMEFSKNYPQIQLELLYVDNAAMQIIKRPFDFDVILTENLFGDILTDESAVIAGSIGLLPSASIGEKTSLFEPIHGSYPQAAGKNIANPIATILSGAMILEYSFNLKKESNLIRKAIKEVLKEGFGTQDLFPEKILGTLELTEKIIQKIEELKDES
jgi:3-isopropylmalate dehydrogenase